MNNQVPEERDELPEKTCPQCGAKEIEANTPRKEELERLKSPKSDVVVDVWIAELVQPFGTDRWHIQSEIHKIVEHATAKLTADNDRLQKELDEKQKALDNSARDWADNDARVKEIAKTVLGDSLSEHDGHGFVGVIGVAEQLVERIKAQRKELDEVKAGLHQLKLEHESLVQQKAVQGITWSQMIAAWSRCIDRIPGLSRTVSLGALDELAEHLGIKERCSNSDEFILIKRDEAEQLRYRIASLEACAAQCLELFNDLMACSHELTKDTLLAIRTIAESGKAVTTNRNFDSNRS